MPSPLCLRCMRRSLQPIEAPTAVQRATFSTSPAHSNVVKKKQNATAKPTMRSGSSLRLKKTNRSTGTSRPPAPGERKALRKRVVLSNTNALEVPGLQDLTEEVAKDSKQLEQLRGSMVGLDNDTVDALRAMEAFKATQGWNLFKRPATLVRGETTELAQAMSEVQSKKSTDRRVLFGTRGSGKSVLQLQGLALARQRGWLCLHIPEASDITRGQTAYEPIVTEDGTRYIQPTLTAQLLGNFARANKQVLSKLRLSKTHKLPVPVPADITLDRFVELGSNDSELAWPIWQALMTELNTPSQSGDGLQRPPLYVSLDGVDHIMRDSAYLDMDGQPIHALDLEIANTFAVFLSGEKSFPNGGMAVAAVSESNRASAPTLDYVLERKAGVKTGHRDPFMPAWDPYMPKDDRVSKLVKGIRAQQIKGLDKEEARGIMEYYARSGMLRSAVTSTLINETWTLAGNGLVGEMERGAVLSRF